MRAPAVSGYGWGAATSVSVSNAMAYGGTGYSLRFPFGPDASGEDSDAEQRFVLELG